MIRIFRNIIDVLFPPLCLACEYPLADYEEYICTKCRHQLPLTHLHKDDENRVEKIFYGRVKIEKATAMLWFEKRSIVQHLIHQLKYKGHEEVGTLLGYWLGSQLNTIPHYTTVDMVIPVPLHPKKYRKRGYNQVTTFGKALAECLQADYVDTLLKKQQHTKTQTYKSRLLRWNTIKDGFEVQQYDVPSNTHILLVDDVITTGATLEACARELLKLKNVKISIATMAIVA